MPSMNAYSKDLRLKTLAAIDRAIPRAEVCELFGISLSTIKRWLQRRRQTGGVETMKIPGRPSLKGRALREWLPGQIGGESRPDPQGALPDVRGRDGHGGLRGND